jgi:hypothetical protein
MNSENDSDVAPEDVGDVYLGQAPDHGDLRQAKTNFQPWHHPRKQYVRIHQWCASVRQLIKDLHLAPGDPFRYLTLPGNEMLDIRALHGVCEPAALKLRYLGFNSVQRGSGDQAELSLSQSEVGRLAGIDPFSIVLEDRLESVSNSLSPAFLRTQQYGPFHAINIDLCDSVAYRDVNDRRGSYLVVLEKLLELQLQTTQPWVLFLTTMAQPSLLSARSREGFMDAINVNTAASAEFKKELARLVSSATDQLDVRLGEAWTGQNPDFLRLFCAGLGKWLLRLLSNVAQPRELSLLSSCYYQVGPDGPDMLSLAFRCNTPPQHLIDQHGVLPKAAPVTPFSETTLAVEMARTLFGSIDLDEKLEADPVLADKLIIQAGRLLATARYREIDYQTWARAELQRRGAG